MQKLVLLCAFMLLTLLPTIAQAMMCEEPKELPKCTVTPERSFCGKPDEGD